MEQHPVPQQISSYEFRLVGDMTLKQFAQVSAGCLISLLFYASPLPGLVKWPFIILFAFAGLAIAFLPFEERPLHVWIIAFLKAVYSPTQYIWQRGGQKPEVFKEPSKELSEPKETTSFLSDLSDAKVITEQEEEKFIERIQGLFSSLPTLPTLKMTPKAPPPKAPQTIETKTTLPTIAIQPIPWQAQPIIIPLIPTLRVVPQYRPPLPTNFFRGQKKDAQEARFTPQIPMPSVPTIANLLVGMVSDSNGKILEGAIIEIRDGQGSAVRALRTNKLGQFRIATPLENDTYEMEIEKEGYQFDTIKVNLKGEIINPLEIRAKPN